jgi:hypothetical protein
VRRLTEARTVRILHSIKIWLKWPAFCGDHITSATIQMPGTYAAKAWGCIDHRQALRPRPSINHLARQHLKINKLIAVLLEQRIDPSRVKHRQNITGGCQREICMIVSWRGPLHRSANNRLEKRCPWNPRDTQNMSLLPSCGRCF